eukprot:5322331-Alexandrium_andersonii.AAC.1
MRGPSPPRDGGVAERVRDLTGPPLGCLGIGGERPNIRVRVQINSNRARGAGGGCACCEETAAAARCRTHT